HDDIDRALLERSNGDGSVLISPAAAAPEGETVFDTWAGKGLAHYERLGIPARVSPLRTREEAERPDVVAMLDEASLVFFSGGNPGRHAGRVGRGHRDGRRRSVVDRLRTPGDPPLPGWFVERSRRGRPLRLLDGVIPWSL